LTETTGAEFSIQAGFALGTAQTADRQFLIAYGAAPRRFITDRSPPLFAGIDINLNPNLKYVNVYINIFNLCFYLFKV
jgi:hypothetical protein